MKFDKKYLILLIIFLLSISAAHASDLNKTDTDINSSDTILKNQNISHEVNQTLSSGKIKTELKIQPVEDIKTSDTLSLNVTLTSAPEGLADLYINQNFFQNVYLNSGTTVLNMSYFEAGRYNISIIYPGNSLYESSQDSVIFNVEKTQAYINVSCKNISSGDDEIITIEVSPDNFHSEIILSINNVNQSIVLTKRITPITISRLNNGTYDVKVYFNGNNRFYKTTASSSFTVFRSKSSLNVTIEKNDLTGQIVVKTNSSKCTGDIDLFINKKLYSGKLYGGAATFDVDFFTGSNYIYINYGGDEFYDGSDWNTTIGNPVNPFLISYDVNSYEYNNFTYKVILCEENGMAMAGRNVIIKFLNETYSIKTDAEGISKLTLNLKEGNYSITSIYENISLTTKITIQKIRFNVRVNDSIYLQDNTITAEFEKNITGLINFKINNIFTSVEIKNNTAVLDIKNLTCGNYTVEAYYSNRYFNSSSIFKSFKILKANFTPSLTIQGLDIGDDTTITLDVLSEMNGMITFIVDEINYEKQVYQNNVNLTLSNLSAGYHNLSIIYSKDSNFNDFIINKKFSIRSQKTNLILIATNETYLNYTTFIAYVNADARGNIEFSTDNVKKIIEIINGTATWRFNGLNSGNYTLNAKYSGDDSYISTQNSTNFEIKKANSQITLYVNDIYLDQNIRIYADLSPNATGFVSYSMEGYYSPRNKTANNGSSSWLISPLEYGEYVVFAKYYGDSNYFPSNTTYILNVTQYRSILSINFDNTRTNERVIAIIKLFNDKGIGLTDSVNLTINGISYSIKTRRGEGTLVIGKLNEGNYTYSAYYAGNNKYKESSINGIFEVYDSLMKVNIEVKNITGYFGKTETLKIYLTDSNGKYIVNENIQLSINNDTYYLMTDASGLATLDIDYPIGHYDVLINFNQTDKYYPCQCKANIEILSTVTSYNLTKLYGSDEQYIAIFTDMNGNALANTKVTFTLLGKSYFFQTAPNGMIKIDINLQPGSYTITAINPVSNEKIINKIFIYSYIMKNKDITMYYGANKKYTIEIYDNTGKKVGKGVNVVVTVNSKIYNLKTDENGVVSLKINFKPKTYTISAIYNNFKVTNRLIVKPLLSGKNLIVKKGNYFKFKAKLVNSKNEPAKSKKLTFKFRGKKYVAKTNKKGIAAIKIKLKLKVGTYKIKTAYGKNTITNKIKIIK